MKRRILLSLFALLLAAPLLAVRNRQPAPPWRARTLDRQVFDNAAAKGRFVLVQFWTTWCGYCRRDQPAVEEIIKKYSQNDLTVLCVAVGQSRATVTKYLAQSPRSCKVVVNDDTNLPAVFGVDGFPKYVVFDKEGKVAGEQEGAGGEDSLRGLLADAGLK